MRFRQIVREWNRQSFAYLGLVSFGTGYGALLPVFPILIAAPQYIAGAMSLGVLMQAAQAFPAPDLRAFLAGGQHRRNRALSCFGRPRAVAYEDIRRLDAEAQEPGGPRIVLDRSDRAQLVIDDLCIADPSGEILLEHFSAEIRRGERVLITGHPVVTGSLFKVIGGLWPLGQRTGDPAG